MEVGVRLTDLATMHPRLLWKDICAAALAILSGDNAKPPFLFDLEIRDVPNFGTDNLRMKIDPSGVSRDYVTRLRRTYEPFRLVELAAIAIAGLGLFYAGQHEIRDIALRGSAADYLVDEANHLLEIAGRSLRSDFGTAWEERWQRLKVHQQAGFYVLCLCCGI